MHNSIIKHGIVRKAIDDRLHTIVQHLKQAIKYTIMSTEATDGALQLQCVTNPSINAMFIQKCTKHGRRLLSVGIEIFSTSIVAHVDYDLVLARLVMRIGVADE